MNHLQIPVDPDDASWKERCSQRMEELKNGQSPMNGESVRERKLMSSTLYGAVKSGNVDNLIDELQQQCMQRKLSDIFDQVTGTGDTLLHVASGMGSERIAELICDHFPELLFMTNIRGDTVLHAAVRSKNSKVVKFIISQYATAKSKHDEMKDKEITREANEYGDTPLHEAVFCGNVDAVKELIHEDQEVVHYLNKSKQSPLYLAAVVKENEEILDLLLEIPFPEHQQLPLCLGNSPLHAAILKGNPALARGILEKRPELVYLKDDDGNTSFHYAAYNGYVEGYDILSKHAINKIDQIALQGNNKGHLPIHLACKRGHIKVVKRFLQLEWPIDPLVLNRKGQNILHVAANNGRSNIVKYLLENPKIDQSTINWKDNYGNTPLHLASINLFPKVLYLLTRDKRTNVNLLNNDGLTAGDAALVSEDRLTYRKFLANLVLKDANVDVKVNDTLSSRHNVELSYKELTETFLLVATLMVTVTFAAVITVPGGVHSSDDPNPKTRGLAVFNNKPLFFLFTVFNMLTMFSSVTACGFILLSFVHYRKLARVLTIAAGWFLAFAFFCAPVAFMTAARLVLPNNSALAPVVTLIGCIYTALLVMVASLINQVGRPGLFLLNRVTIPILVTISYYDDKLHKSLRSERKRTKDA